MSLINSFTIFTGNSTAVNCCRDDDAAARCDRVWMPEREVELLKHTYTLKGKGRSY